MAAKSTLWFGVLEAGEKTSPVVRDDTLDTGNPSTLYLFNLKRSAILEYRTEIANQLLRELGLDEEHLVAELKKEYKAVRAGFTPRKESRPRPQTKVRRPEPEPEPEEPSGDEIEDEMPDMPLLDDDPGLDGDSAEA